MCLVPLLELTRLDTQHETRCHRRARVSQQKLLVCCPSETGDADGPPNSIPIHERVELPESWIPADSRVEIDAKINAGMVQWLLAPPLSASSLTQKLPRRLLHDWPSNDRGRAQVCARPDLGGVSTKAEGLLTNEGSTGLTREPVSTTKVNQDSSSAASELQIVGVFINPLVPLRPARDPVRERANAVSIPCHEAKRTSR